MSKKINQLDAATDANTLNDSYLLPIADNVNGIALKMTVAQAKQAYGVNKLIYKALGTEGTTLTITTLSGKNILAIGRGIGFIYETGSSPDGDEYTWDDTSIVLGAPVNLNEKFLILYRNY